MMEFSYRALDKKGELLTGAIDAPDRATAIVNLYGTGLTPLDVSGNGPTFAMRLNEPVTFFEQPSQRDIQAFLRDLGRLLAAGLSVDDGLKLLEKMQTRDMLARAIEKTRGKVRQGESLASSLSEYRKYFHVQVIAAVQAGELSGTLPEALDTLASSMDQALSFKERVRSALIYPMILMLMVGLTFFLVMTFVLPQFAPLFDGNEDKLPWATRFVMGMGDLFNSYWYVLAGFVSGAVVFLLGVSFNSERRGRFQAAVCRIPWVNGWLLTPDIVRFVRTLGVCVRSGVALDAAMGMAIDAVRLPHISEQLKEVRNMVRRGASLSQGLQSLAWMPRLVLQFSHVGEQSGRLGPMLDEAATIVAQNYETRLEKALELFSPLMTLVMGGVVALLVGSVLLGIMSINDVAF